MNPAPVPSLFSFTSPRASHRKAELLVRNAHDAVAMLQLTEQALTLCSRRLYSMMALAAKASSGRSDAANGLELDAEFSRLRQELSQVIENTEFNGRPLLAQARLQFWLDDDPVELVLPDLLAGIDTLQLAGSGSSSHAERDLQLRVLTLTQTLRECRIGLQDVCKAAHRSLTRRHRAPQLMCA